ncbi:hypothetical protein [Streptomyces cyaneofuscatus]|uniref:hypothetical protein n=1 Tax=Streptomyces cyaneofuscatus TaxID=66883 RepID=UPI0037B31519
MNHGQGQSLPWIPAAGPARGLAVAQLVNSLGDGAYYVRSALYFSQVVGLSAAQIGFDLAPAGRRGQYQGFFGAGVPVARMLGPLVLTTLIVTWGPPGWLVLGTLFLGAGAAMGPAVRWAERSRPTAPAMASVRPSGPPSTAR